MERTYASEINKAMKSKSVRLCGWVESIRDLGNLKFIILRDATGTVQITIKKGDAGKSVIDAADKLGREFVITVEGVVKENEKAPKSVEISPAKITTLSESATIFPTEIGGAVKSNLDTRLDWRSLDLRNPKNAAVFRIQSKLLEGFREYLVKNNFMQAFTPCILGSTSEGGSEVFPVVYFDKQAFLRQDPQLHRQLCIIAGFEKIYDIGPSWRAELSHTVRHLCEHRGVAVELAFINDEYDVMRIEEQLIDSGINKVAKDSKEDFEILGVEIPKLKLPFPVLEFPKVYDVLAEFGIKLSPGEEYGREAEETLGAYAKDKFKSDFLFVNKFPFAKKPFYVMRDGMYARSTDLIFRGIEQSSGGQREHRYDELMKNVKEKKLNPSSMEWFTKFFKFGAPPHGGFCMGVERFTMQLTGVQNVREATLFPRDPERLLP
ncbi:MAG: aspartate--tRNA(Asn) ligase [Candidatus Aenigmatarchaeota archaeon]